MHLNVLHPYKRKYTKYNNLLSEKILKILKLRHNPTLRAIMSFISSHDVKNSETSSCAASSVPSYTTFLLYKIIVVY